MKKIFLILVGFAVVIFGGFSQVLADDAPVQLGQNGLPDQATVSGNCRSAQSLLGRIERADSVIRVNRGSDYNNILNLFFAMNARLASQKISAPKLADITNNFQNELENFRDFYNKYDDSLSAPISVDCSNDPTGFYGNLQKSRTFVNSLNQSTTNLDNLVQDYKNELMNITSQNGDKK